MNKFFKKKKEIFYKYEYDLYLSFEKQINIRINMYNTLINFNHYTYLEERKPNTEEGNIKLKKYIEAEKEFYNKINILNWIKSFKSYKN